MPSKTIQDPAGGGTLEISGSYNPVAPRLQRLVSPVSGFPLDIAAGWPPVQWETITVVKKYNPVITFDKFKQLKPDVASNIEKSIRPEDRKPAIELFSLQPLQQPLTNVFYSLVSVGALFFVLWLIFKQKGE